MVTIGGRPVREEPRVANVVNVRTPVLSRRSGALLEENERNWQAFFESSRIMPLVIEYEDLASEYAGTIQKVLQWLGIPEAGRAPIPAPRLRRQVRCASPGMGPRVTPP